MAEPEYDDENRAHMIGLALLEETLCPLCGRPQHICQAEQNEDAFTADLPARCHSHTALLRAQKQAAEREMPNPEALLWGTVFTPEEA